jgi:hypothetical protein
MVVTAGAMKLGRIAQGRGTVLAIDRQTRYAFKLGEQLLSYINF